MKTARLTRKYALRALHNLNNPHLSDEENSRLYGLCYRLHGHDYQIMVTVEAPIHPVSGLSISRDDLDALVHRELIAPYDGHFLNESFINTSGEALSRLFFAKLSAAAGDLLTKTGGRLVQVSIQETRKNWFAHTAALAASPGA
jgi:6-pyruvoyltetrahydropterin/6-carboxytetrahydropterin synthase